MQVAVSQQSIAEVGADAVAVALAEEEELPEELRDAPGAADAKPGFEKLATLYPEGRPRAIVVGVGKPEDVDAERLRVAAALVAKHARALDARTLAWSLASIQLDLATAARAVVEGTNLAGYRFDLYRSRDDDRPTKLELLTLLSDDPDVEWEAHVAHVASEAANRARKLQDTPANELTPIELARRAEELAAELPQLKYDVLGPREMIDHSMGGLSAVSAGSAQEPRLIMLRYSAGGDGETIGLIGKAVTFDTGGISIKPSGRMHEMKMDMSGGAAVLEAMGAIAELELPINLVAVVPAVENMPSGTATKPGDVIRQYNGKMVEVTNTDAEGRLILADALAFSIDMLGVDRVIDLATLTGAVVVALGSTYAALISNDDEWAGRVQRAAEETGELAWRLPLHPEYKELTKGTITDLVNSAAKRKAGTIYAGSFLEEFVEGKPWCHLDIAGTAWDVDREYVGKGATGFGVRLLVQLARDLAA